MYKASNVTTIASRKVISFYRHSANKSIKSYSKMTKITDQLNTPFHRVCQAPRLIILASIQANKCTDPLKLKPIAVTRNRTHHRTQRHLPRQQNHLFFANLEISTQSPTTRNENSLVHESKKSQLGAIISNLAEQNYCLHHL